MLVLLQILEFCVKYNYLVFFLFYNFLKKILFVVFADNIYDGISVILLSLHDFIFVHLFQFPAGFLQIYSNAMNKCL